MFPRVTLSSKKLLLPPNVLELPWLSTQKEAYADLTLQADTWEFGHFDPQHRFLVTRIVQSWFASICHLGWWWACLYVCWNKTRKTILRAPHKVWQQVNPGARMTNPLKLRSRAKLVILTKMASPEEDPPVQGQEIESEGGDGGCRLRQPHICC